MNIKEVAYNIIHNFDENVQNYINLLNKINCELIYSDSGLKTCIYERTVYACSIQYTKKNKKKILKSVLPIMIGSKLDIGIRKLNMLKFNDLSEIPNILDWEKDFEPADIAITCFLINGTLKQIPFFITNDATNPHIVKNSIVRLYHYDSNEKGKELSLYFDDFDEFKRGSLVVRLNDGKYSYDLEHFFDCPYPVDTKVYFEQIFKEGFKIDNLENRIVISPGHLFFKLLVRNLYIPLRNGDYENIIKKYIIVYKSIINGDLLHIISKKTLFLKETNMKYKMVNVRSETQQREIGSNDEIFIEKKSTPYRDANCQCYPYLPYLSHFTNLQISSKVKSVKILSYNNSYIGFLCVLGTSDTKNVGRVMMLSKNVFISTNGNLEQLYEYLNIEIGNDAYIVINSACIKVTQRYFDNLNLKQLKEKFLFIECFIKLSNMICINFKIGIPFKKLEDNIWVTPRDIKYWIKILYDFDTIEKIVELKGYDFITSYGVDFIKYYKHNAFPKNILTLNAMKNAVFATSSKYSLFYCETISAYVVKTSLHQPVLKPLNKFSEHFTLYLPKLNVMFASFKGCTQEDSIVLRDDLNVFDIYCLYTVKIKFGSKTDKYFHPARGKQNPVDKMTFLGTITGKEINIISQTMHLHIEPKGETVIDLFFSKPNFEIIQYKVSPTYLFISIQSFHPCSTGDKLCSLHGQKGVLQKHKSLPYAEGMKPDLIINPYCFISRQTMGQLIEALHSGGKDYENLYNSDGKRVLGTAFMGHVFYFPIKYFSSDHIYTAINCKKDKIKGQAVRGRSRQGGMKYGTMEVYNGGLGTGMAHTNSEIIGEHSDRIIINDIALPQSVILCNEDAKFFKCNIKYEIEEPIQELFE